LLVVKNGQAVEAHGQVGMVGTESLLPDRQRTLVERLGVGVSALGSAQNRQVE
jgi:hypothetical protein